MDPEFNFETEPFRLDRSNTPDLELEQKMVGGIPERDYLRWVQRSLNRAFRNATLPITVAVNGRDSTGFRSAVTRFKSLVKLKPADTKIDIPTQNKLIKANQTDRAYMAWAQAQLNKLGSGSLSITGKYDTPTMQAIRAFQAYYDGHFGFALGDDGFIGAKTELALRLATLEPPRKPRRPKPRPDTVVTDEQVYNQLLRAGEWIDEFADASRYPTELCIIAKLKNSATDDRYWDPAVIHAFMDLPLRPSNELHDRSARERLKVFIKARRDTNRPVTAESVVRKISDIVSDITDGIRSLEISYCDDPRLPGLQHRVKKAAARRSTLYNCPHIRKQAQEMEQCVG